MKHMPSYGPFSEHQLAEKLVSVPDAEMKAYHGRRMRTYKIQYIPAVILAILSVVFWFIEIIWLSVLVGSIGFVFFSFVVYKKQSWLRLYHHLTYLREQRLHTLDELTPKKKSAQKYHQLEKKEGRNPK